MKVIVGEKNLFVRKTIKSIVVVVVVVVVAVVGI